MWSLGCVIAELFLGWPLYPGALEYDQVIKSLADDLERFIVRLHVCSFSLSLTKYINIELLNLHDISGKESCAVLKPSVPLNDLE